MPAGCTDINSVSAKASLEHLGTTLVVSDATFMMPENYDLAAMMAGNFGVAAMF